MSYVYIESHLLVMWSHTLGLVQLYHDPIILYFSFDFFFFFNFGFIIIIIIMENTKVIFIKAQI